MAASASGPSARAEATSAGRLPVVQASRARMPAVPRGPAPRAAQSPEGRGVERRGALVGQTPVCTIRCGARRSGRASISGMSEQETIGAQFARALAVKDFAKLGDLLHPEIDFRGLVCSGFGPAQP